MAVYDSFVTTPFWIKCMGMRIKEACGYCEVIIIIIDILHFRSHLAMQASVCGTHLASWQRKQNAGSIVVSAYCRAVDNVHTHLLALIRRYTQRVTRIITTVTTSTATAKRPPVIAPIKVSAMQTVCQRQQTHGYTHHPHPSGCIGG